MFLYFIDIINYHIYSHAMFLDKAINIFKKRAPLVLVFMRHGRDHYETGELLPSGIRGVKEQGARLSEWFMPDLILSSDALRADQTANILSDIFAAKAGAAKLPIHHDENLAYRIGNSPDFISKTLPMIQGDVKNIVSTSHSETLNTNIKHLTGKSAFLGHAEMVVFRFKARRWADIDASNLIDFDLGQHIIAPEP